MGDRQLEADQRQLRHGQEGLAIFRLRLCSFSCKAASGTAGPSQLCRARARIAEALLFAGPERLIGRRGVNPRSQPVAKGLLDAAILAAVKADDGDAAAGIQAFRQGAQQGLEVRHFAIDENSQGLKDAGDRTDALLPRRALSGAVHDFHWRGLLNQVGQFDRAPRRRTFSRCDNGCSDAVGLRFVAKFAERLGQFRLRKGRQ